MLIHYSSVLLCTCFVVFSNVHVFAQLYEGSPCTNNNNKNEQGICKFLTDCPKAVELLQKGVFPQTCGFKGTQPIVCCFQNEAVPPIKTRAVGEISKQKCREYVKYLKKKNKPAILLADDEVTETKECGQLNIELVVGGTPASRLEFPHMALVGYQEEEGDDIKWRCGGSIISERFVLTAAHCLESRDLGFAKYILVGVTNIKEKTGREQVRVKNGIAHPDYHYPLHYNDIGLLELERNIKLNTRARPACLYTEHNIPVKRAIASGWGKVEFVSTTTSDFLLKVILELFGGDECSRSYQNLDKLPDGIRDDVMICAGSRTEFKDTCQGDSGGPLQIYHNRSDAECMYDVVGVVSFGKACGLVVNLPGVYTRVSHYTKWIEDTVWPAV